VYYFTGSWDLGLRASRNRQTGLCSVGEPQRKGIESVGTLRRMNATLA
jgi:hypothetical protein